MTPIYGNDEKQKSPRPPLSPALLAQAASIEHDVCFGLNGDNTIGAAMPSETGQVVVTWRGVDHEGDESKF